MEHIDPRIPLVRGGDAAVAVLGDRSLAHDAPRIEALLASHGALVLRGVLDSDADLVRLLELLGPAMFTAGETPVAGHPTLNVVTNVGRARPPRSVFHTDTSYEPRPPAITALRAIEAPDRGGETLVTDQVRALATLPCATRGVIARRSMAHRATGVPDSAGAQSVSWHPLVRKHPVSGDLALYISTPDRCEQISGLSRADSRMLAHRLHRHSTHPSNVRVHRWRAGDVLLVDDRITLHRADHSATVGRRVLHRGLVEGESPLAVQRTEAPEERP